MNVPADYLFSLPAIESFRADIEEFEIALEVANHDGFSGEVEQFGVLRNSSCARVHVVPDFD